MIKVMHLDMFYFEYSPVFSEGEKVLYKNGNIIVSYNGTEKYLDATDVSNVKLDTLFADRLQQKWTSIDIKNSLEAIDSDNQKEKEKYRLLYIEPEDEKDVSFEFMLETLRKLNYNDTSFEYIAYGE